MADSDELVVRTFGLTKEFAPNIGAIDVNLEVKRGEVYGFLGPNGAGKSTTLRMLTGVSRPDRGTAEVLGLDPWAAPTELMTRIGVLNSETAFAPHHTGTSQIQLVARIRSLPSFTTRANELAERFELDLTRRARDLSLGNRQKLGLILALAHQPELLILDEPTSGLDPLMQRRIDDHLRELVRDGTSVLLSSHSLPQVQRTADRVGFIRDARLVVQGPLSMLRASHVHRALLTFREPPHASWFANIDGDTEVTEAAVLSSDSIELSWRGPAAAVLARAGERGVLTIDTLQNDLEHSFLALYDPAASDSPAANKTEKETLS